MNIMKNTILVLTLFTASLCIGQHALQKERLALDDSLHLAVFNIKDSLFADTQEFLWNNQVFVLTQQDATYSLQPKNSNTNYTAYNTPLALMQVNAPNGIVNEPKRMSTITYADSTKVFTSHAGIELRGSSSQFFSKKTYDLNFHKDSLGLKNRNLRLGTMREDDDWILDGLYNEPLRLRSHLSLELWKKVYSPSYLDKEPKAQSGVSTTFCELVVNGQYKGIYLISEQVDRKLLKLVKEDSTGVRGELFQGSAYQGAVTFDSLPPKKNYLSRWGGHDIKYPYPNDRPWDNIYEFTDAIINGDEDAFAKAVNTQLNLSNIIDYFLFINALRAPDNLGKNIYLARYDRDEPYFYIPWDLDGTFGTIFSGRELDITNDFLNNGLLRRLLKENPENFRSLFKARWKELRTTSLNIKTVLQWQKDNYLYLLNSGAYAREKMAWNTLDYSTQRLNYMNTWTKKRFKFLDTYMENLPATVD